MSYCFPGLALINTIFISCYYYYNTYILYYNNWLSSFLYKFIQQFKTLLLLIISCGIKWLGCDWTHKIEGIIWCHLVDATWRPSLESARRKWKDTYYILNCYLNLSIVSRKTSMPPIRPYNWFFWLLGHSLFIFS